jgi:hypothetical protein
MAEGPWSKVSGWLSRNAKAYVLAPIPLDDEGEAAPLEPRESYLRVWLSEMCLAKRGSWLGSWSPAVHAEVRLPFGGQPAVTFSRVVRPGDDVLGDGTPGEGVLLNYPLTELVPFNGGTVEIEAALLGLKSDGNDPLAAGVTMLESFSGLITPPLGQVLAAAAKLTTSAPGVPRPRQRRRPPGPPPDPRLRRRGRRQRPPPRLPRGRPRHGSPGPAPASLRVRGDRLYQLGSDSGSDHERPKPFTSHDFMLLRIEGREERDDWELLLPEIMEARSRALDALLRSLPVGLVS